jgi:hypothetical protein
MALSIHRKRGAQRQFPYKNTVADGEFDRREGRRAETKPPQHDVGEYLCVIRPSPLLMNHYEGSKNRLFSQPPRLEHDRLVAPSRTVVIT